MTPRARSRPTAALASGCCRGSSGTAPPWSPRPTRLLLRGCASSASPTGRARMPRPRLPCGHAANRLWSQPGRILDGRPLGRQLAGGCCRRTTPTPPWPRGWRPA
eukprot:12832497-Alexandrium_andersonii.AAC.1